MYLINSNRDRQGLMERLYGIERVIFAPFDREMMTMPWEAYLEMLIGTYGAVHFVAGTTTGSAIKTPGTCSFCGRSARRWASGRHHPRRYSGRASRSAPRTSGRWWRRATWSARRTFWATGHCLSQTVQHGTADRADHRHPHGKPGGAGARAGPGARGIRDGGISAGRTAVRRA